MDMDIKHAEQLELHQIELTDGRVFRRGGGGRCWVQITSDPGASFPLWEDIDADVSVELERIYQERIQNGIAPSLYSE